MQIGAKTAVMFHYKLRDDEGTELDSSEGAEPLTYLHMARATSSRGWRRRWRESSPATRWKVKVSPEEGYGVRDDKNIQNVPRRKLPEGKIQPGMRCGCRRNHGRSSRW
jgi:FKBP-type peptidyl-prolyl cis-trans isomerase SlyD